MTDTRDMASPSPKTTLVSYDRDEALAAFGREPFRVQHGLADHPLFSLDALADLADRLPPEVVEHNLGSVGALEPGGEVPKLDASPGDVVRGIETNGCWVVLPIVLAEMDPVPGYGDVYEQVLTDVAPMVPGGRDAMRGNHSVIFLAAAGSVTPSHVDGELGFLLHMRGDKRLSIGRYADAETERHELEGFFTGEHRNTAQLPVDVHDFDLVGGTGLHVPPLTPHWVTNGDTVAISLSVGFQTPANLRREGVYKFNARARRLGLTPKPFGQDERRDRVKASILTGAATARRRLARR